MSEANQPTPESADEFARAWYDVDEVTRMISRATQSRIAKLASGDLDLHMPVDVASREFAQWLADFGAMAMAKGVRIGREWERRKAGDA